jgi:hypothetical protein
MRPTLRPAVYALRQCRSLQRRVWSIGDDSLGELAKRVRHYVGFKVLCSERREAPSTRDGVGNRNCVALWHAGHSARDSKSGSGEAEGITRCTPLARTCGANSKIATSW